MSLRGKEFPPLVQEAGHGYKLHILVPGLDGRERIVFIPPPQSVVAPDTEIWPPWCFQLLLVASEYVAALHEFMTWSFPPEWGPLKAQVADHARQLIRTSAVAMPQPPPGQPELSAFRVWAAFTHCYFHGLRGPADIPYNNINSSDSNSNSGECREATRWLHRLVGERSWQPEGPVYCAAARWVQATIDRLQPLFPSVATTSARDWAPDGQHEALRPLAQRGEKNAMGRYVPVYPFHMSGTWSGNRLKFTLRSQQAPRSVTGCCGVPSKFGQTNNCALGFLVLADVCVAFTAAFEKATKPNCCLNGREELQRAIIQDFYDSVLSNDTANFNSEYLPYGFPSYLAACAMGWKLALDQVPLWLEAAAGSAAAAALANATEGVQPKLLMPREQPLGPQQWQLQLQLIPTHEQQQRVQEVMQQAHDKQQQQQQQQHEPQQLNQEGQLTYISFAQQQQQQPPRSHQQPYTGAAWAPLAAAPDAVVPPPVVSAAESLGCPSLLTTPGLPLLRPSLPLVSGGSGPSLSCGSLGGLTAISPFAVMQQQQQRQGSAALQHRSLPPLSSTPPSFSSPSNDPRASHPTAHAAQAPQAMTAAQEAVPHHHPPLLQLPPARSPPPLSPPPYPAGNTDSAPPADTDVTSGLSNMSLDGSLLTFGDTTLRLITDDVRAHELGGEPALGMAEGMARAVRAAAVAAACDGHTGSVAPDGGLTNAVLRLSPEPLLGGSNGFRSHLPVCAKGPIPTRTVTTLLQAPQHPHQAHASQPAISASPAASPEDRPGLLPTNAPAPSSAAAANGDGYDNINAANASACAEAGAVSWLQAGVAALRQLLDTHPPDVRPHPRVVRLHREVAAALETYSNHYHQNHFYQQQQQHAVCASTTVAVADGTGTCASLGGGRAAAPPQPPLTAPVPGPFGGTVHLTPSLGLPVGPFGAGGSLAIPGLAAGPFGAAGAAAAANPLVPPPAAAAGDSQFAAMGLGKGQSQGDTGPVHNLGTAGLGTHSPAAASPPALQDQPRDCFRNSFHDGGIQEVKQEAFVATATPLGPMGQVMAVAAAADGGHEDAAGGGGAGMGCVTRSGSPGFFSLLGTVDCDNSLLGLGLGLAGGGVGGGGVASVMSWSRGGASLDIVVSPTGIGRVAGGGGGASGDGVDDVDVGGVGAVGGDVEGTAGLGCLDTNSELGTHVGTQAARGWAECLRSSP